jgi:hypothetical protein
MYGYSFRYSEEQNNIKLRLAIEIAEHFTDSI